jgi:hypothetical protein
VPFASLALYVVAEDLRNIREEVEEDVAKSRRCVVGPLRESADGELSQSLAYRFEVECQGFIIVQVR